MRRKIAIAATLAATLIGAAACSDKPTEPAVNPLDGKGKTVKVWLMVDAQTSLEGRRRRRHQAVHRRHRRPGQRRVPAVGERPHQAGRDAGRHRRAGRGRAGQHPVRQVHLQRRFRRRLEPEPTSRTPAPGWRASRAPVTSDGKTYCVPYYAGARVLIYRKDLFEKAGITAAEDVRRVPQRRRQAADRERQPTRSSARSTCRASTGTRRCPGSRPSGGDIAKKERRQVGRPAVPAAVDRRPAEVGRPGQEVLEGGRHQGRERPGRHLRAGRRPPCSTATPGSRVAAEQIKARTRTTPTRRWWTPRSRASLAVRADAGASRPSSAARTSA